MTVPPRPARLKTPAAGHAAISPTAFGVAWRRTHCDIPFSRDIFKEIEKLCSAGGPLILADRVKATELTPLFEARYKLVDRLLEQSGAGQVLEIAAGFSPRGMARTAASSSTRYVELELAGIARQKREIIASLIAQGKLASRAHLHVETGNALHKKDVETSVSYFDQNEPIAVVNEGLLRYLTFGERARLARNILALLKRFGGVWITPDIWIRQQWLDMKKMRAHTHMLEQETGRNIEQNHFATQAAARDFFEQLGFVIEPHPFSEVVDQLASPSRLNISSQAVESLTANAVAYVMRPGKGHRYLSCRE